MKSKQLSPELRNERARATGIIVQARKYMHKHKLVERSSQVDILLKRVLKCIEDDELEMFPPTVRLKK